MRRAGFLNGLTALGIFCAAGLAPRNEAAPASDKVPITTSSEEARQLYLKGRDLNERLQATNGRRYFEQAIAKDKDFALAYLGLANTAGTTKEFFDALKQAVALAPRVSEGERLMIQGADAGARGQLAVQADHYKRLVASFPGDERARNLLGGYYFGRQEYENAVEHYKKAVEINPSFTQPYNQLGYSYRFLEKYADAEATFKKYTELLPKDPNPYDSYAELLMKTGRFADSIRTYEKALAHDKYFIASHIGIGNDYVFMGQSEKARQSFAQIAALARNDGERRTAHFWMAASYVHDGATDKALAELQKMVEIARAAKDSGSVSGDLNQMGDVLREAGRLDESLARYVESVEAMATADVPVETKEAVRRNQLFEEGRIALARKDLATAKARSDAYSKEATAKAIPFELRQSHELRGAIALAESRFAEAVAELEQANRLDPRVLYLHALALQGKGDATKAAAMAAQAANYNAFSFNYGFVRGKAKKLAGA